MEEGASLLLLPDMTLILPSFLKWSSCWPGQDSRREEKPAACAEKPWQKLAVPVVVQVSRWVRCRSVSSGPQEESERSVVIMPGEASKSRSAARTQHARVQAGQRESKVPHHPPLFDAAAVALHERVPAPGQLTHGVKLEVSTLAPFG